MKYTYIQNTEAHYGRDEYQRAIVPDQVANDQRGWDGRAFPAKIVSHWGTKQPTRTVRVVLRGDLYGLHTGGTGDMIVTSEQRGKK
jgi:hypothetical protein